MTIRGKSVRIPDQAIIFFLIFRVNVRVGEYDTSTKDDCVINQGCNTGYTIDVGVEEAIAHPGWNQGDPAKLNDIALVRLNQDLTFNRKNSIVLC